MAASLSYLLDKKDLARRPKELRAICLRIFHKGKGLRAQMASRAGRALSLKSADCRLLSRIVEYIHNSSLLHDDFIDQALTRRRRRAAWLEFSPPQAVLAGDYLLAKVNVYLAQTKNAALVKKTAEAVIQLAQGEFLQRELMNFKDKDLKKRDRISELKTASLFRWCLQAPFIYKNRNNKELFRLLDKIGFFMGALFQRSDDLMDFSVRNKDKKPYFSDLKQKQFNSFACFLLQGEPLKKEQALKKTRSLQSLKRLFPDFEAKVKAFDALNERLIKKAYKSVDKLKPFLSLKERAFISDLKEQIYFLYWRTKKPRKAGA